MSEIQYPVAYNKNGILVNIQNAEEHGYYICPGCKVRMVANLGELRQHYFSHYPDSPNNPSELKRASECIKSSESYLHNAFKTGLYNILERKIKDGEPFSVQWNVSNIGKQEIDLLTIARKIEIETKVDELRPDITLYDKDGRACFAIEIVVCNHPDKKKLKYFSNNNISLYEIDLDKNNLDVLNHIEEIARYPNVFSYVPAPDGKDIAYERVCETCGEETFFSFMNINQIKCAKCQTESRFAYRTLKNKDKNEIRYRFDRYTTVSERYLLDIHGLNYNEKSFDFICENPECKNIIKAANLKNEGDLIYPLGYFCQRCQGKKNGEVTYRGIKFQNKVEIKWAEFFDSLGVEYEYHPSSGIPAFPIFHLRMGNGSKQMFRANKSDRFESIDRAKLELLADTTDEDCIIGFEDGHFIVRDYMDFLDESNSLFVQCKKCNKYYFKTKIEVDKCLHCGFDDDDKNTYIEIGCGDEGIFDDEDN